jgi:hypothetical protein
MLPVELLRKNCLQKMGFFRQIATFQQQYNDIVACINGTESIDLRSRISVPKIEKGKVDA